MSKNRLNEILKQLKPMITLLVTILGSTTIAGIISIINASLLTVEGTSFLKHVVLPNSPYLDLPLHPLVYDLYFTKICQPLCRRFKGMAQSYKFNKTMNAISPSQACHGRSIQTAWM